jgi:hypothetical protein
MRPIKVVTTLILAGSITVLAGAGKRSGIQPMGDASVSTNDNTKSAPATMKTTELPTVVSPHEAEMPQQVTAGAAPVFTMDWMSVNEGGATDVASGNYQMGHSVGQSAAGLVAGTTYQMGFGFWYGAGSAVACPIALTGDVNLVSAVNSTDIIYLVNYVLKAGPAPLPCPASGDATCNNVVNSTDIIYLVNYVFKAGPPPCDVCTLIPAFWSCP